MSATGEALKARGLRFKAEYVMEDKLPSGPPTGFYPDWMRGFWQMPIIGPQPDRWESSGDWETDCRTTIGEAQRQAHAFIEQLQSRGFRDPMPVKENYCFDMNAPDYKRELAKSSKLFEERKMNGPPCRIPFEGGVAWRKRWKSHRRWLMTIMSTATAGG